MTLIEKTGYILLYLLRCVRFAGGVIAIAATAFITGAVGLALATACVWLMASSPDTATFGEFLRFIHSPIIETMAGIGGFTSLALRTSFFRCWC
ncbi:hypothetical protein [Pseudomonas baetica]|uniref:hypothetical protein n=1 Tax=Pseudomonas baetica TaxID=674054 RepID=UPI002404BF9B|nr:hypothetical protein [Pseudomonas baetica]MDF9778983.1 hypothetical protein [Pseudomonas baetica]